MLDLEVPSVRHDGTAQNVYFASTRLTIPKCLDERITANRTLEKNQPTELNMHE